MLRTYFYLGFLLLFFIFILSCKSKKKPIAQGKAGEIHILIDKRFANHPVREVIGQVFNMESPYQCKIEFFENWEKHKQNRNLLLIGNVNDNTDISTIILSHLSEKMRENARKNLGFVKVENDTFAIPQKIIYAYSGSDSLLVERLLQKGNNLADEFRLFEQKQVYHSLYKEGFEQKLSENMFLNHDFYLKLPKNTKITTSEPQKLTLSHLDFTGTIVYADSAQILPKIEPLQQEKEHIFEFKNIKVLSLYKGKAIQFAFFDETHKRKYVFDFKVKDIEKVIMIQTLFSTFEGVTEHNARLKFDKI